MMDIGEFRIGQIKGEVDYGNFNEVVQTDTKHEPCNINVFSKCGKFECLDSETDLFDHINANYSCLDQNEEIKYNPEIPEFVDPSKISEELSRNECRREQINNTDIFYKDIKCEIGEEEVKEICEVCNKSFSCKAEFIESKDKKFECSCQEQNYSVNPKDEYINRDVKQSSLISTTDFGLQLLPFQEETISEDNNQALPVKPQGNSNLPIPSNIPDDWLFPKRKCPSISIDNDLSVKPQMTEKTEKKFQCEFCSKSFYRLQTLKNHKNIHTEEKLFHCKSCSKAFIILSHLKSHEKIHTGEKPFHCKFCSKLFSRFGSLKIHQRLHTGEKPYNCKICSKSFISSSTLKDHEKTHSREKPFHCKICSKPFKRAKTLKSHEIIHIEERPFDCKLCPKTFRSLRYLTIHEKNHTGEKPFQCEICLKSFKLAKTLTVHATIHISEKPFNCEICLKSFNYSRDLKIHERVHTGERPYHCNICLKSYVRKASLRVHSKIHTELETSRLNFEKS